jgi:hypothetical protein
MHFNENVIRWVLGLCLDVVVATVAVRSGLFKRLPVFTTYLFFVAACDVLSTAFRGFFGTNSFPTFYEYWAGQAIMMGMRAAAVGEICFRILGPYNGIWRLWRLFLAGVALFLLVSAAFSAAGQQHSMNIFITLLQRGLELAIVGTLAFSLVFAKYYELKIERFMGLIVGGLFFYSAVQIGNSQLMTSLKGSYYDIYASLTLVSFDIASLIWLAAVWRPVPAVPVAPRARDIDAFGVSIPQVNARLRALNALLLEILR